MSVVDWLVVGTGPSGTAAAAALIRTGIKPTLIDGGGRSAAVPGRVELGGRGEPGRKAWFGSTAVYAQPEPAQVAYHGDLTVRASYAQGGFSRVWGASVELPSAWDAWPAEARPHSSDFALLNELLPTATTMWGSGPGAEPATVPGSPQSWTAMRRVAAVCADRSWVVQPSTVAIQTAPRASNVCRPCAQCLGGCSRNSIWFAGDAVDAWSAQGLVDYRPGFTVFAASEKARGVEVYVRSPSGSAESIAASRLLIGAGPISSAAIALKSDLTDFVRIADTATAFTGFLASGAAPSFDGYYHGLAQWLIRDRQERLLAQVYPPSSLHGARLAERLPRTVLRTWSARRIARHIHPVISYLCQEESDTVVVTKQGDGVIAKPDGDASRSRFESRLRNLSSIFRRAGYWLPGFASEFTAAGTGYHLGASWPHGTGSDVLGRLPGTGRIHFIDSSVLPYLRVGSITPTVMLNAMRIARELSEAS